MKINFIPLSREQFAQLREAKRIIKEEFNADLQLQDKNVLEQLYKYALESKNDRLFDIFNEIYQSHADNTDPQQGDQKVVQHPKSKKIAAQSADDENLSLIHI